MLSSTYGFDNQNVSRRCQICSRGAESLPVGSHWIRCICPAGKTVRLQPLTQDTLKEAEMHDTPLVPTVLLCMSPPTSPGPQHRLASLHSKSHSVELLRPSSLQRFHLQSNCNPPRFPPSHHHIRLSQHFTVLPTSDQRGEESTWTEK